MAESTVSVSADVERQPGISIPNRPESEPGGSADNGMGPIQTEECTTMTFHNIVYTVQVRKRCCTVVPTQIIKGVSGIFEPGLNAIMGATGSGKTSLLDIMAARKNPSGLEGSVLVNGDEQPSNFKCMAGYVVQDDVVMGTLTVRENLRFSANLRLPRSVSSKEKACRVNNCINELGLSHVADSKVGTEFIRGISGGERKRTNIGMELIISPKVLFLDEPTTGLDASTANAVMLLLYRLGMKGKTIIFSIHQPRYSIFRLFNNLVLLSRGHMVYQGLAAEALEYFSTIGYQCEEHNNPADFFLDIINGDSTAVQMSSTIKGDDTNLLSSIHYEADEEAEDKLATELCEKFKASQWSTAVLARVKAATSKSGGLHTGVALPQGHYPTSFFIQLGIVSKRAVLNIVRNPQTSVMQLMVMVIFAFLVGIIYFQMELNAAGLRNRIGAFFFIIMNQIFGNLSAVELFIKERKIFIHENSNGFYRVSAYFLAKLFCDVIPMRFIPNLLFSVVVYFMTGLRIDVGVGPFFFFVLMLSVTSLTASSLGFFFSATVSTFAIANLCIALSYVFMMVFSGLLVQLDSVLVFLRWIKWISIFRYGLNGLSVNELDGLNFCDKYGNITVCVSGHDSMDSASIPYATTWDMWVNPVALLCMAFCFLVLTYIQLRRVNKYT